MMSKGTRTLVRERSAKADDLRQIDTLRRRTEEVEKGFVRQKNSLERGDKVKDNLSKFHEEGWKILENPELDMKNTEALVSAPNFSICGRSINMTPKKAFNVIFKKAIPIIAEILNRNLGESHSYNTSTTARHSKKGVDIRETRHFLGILCLVTTMRGPDCKSHIENFRKIWHTPIGWNRYRTLLSCYEPNNEEFGLLENAFRTTFQECWIPGRQIAVDESVWSYCPGKVVLDGCRREGIRIPLVYIPRKPHPNGMMAYLLACTSHSTGLPFVLDFELHRNFPQISAVASAKAFLARWPYPTKMDLVADSAFGSFNTLTHLQEMGHDGTLSVPLKTKTWL
jgi:hypothetical protein